MKTISVYVAAHKKIDLSLPACYRICQVNAEKNGRWDGNYVFDNGAPDNISLKNDRYCELTALYELWRNNDADLKGLAHYRRFFSNRNALTLRSFFDYTISKSETMDRVLSEKQIREYLKEADIILQYPRSPGIVNAYEDLLRFVFPKDIRTLSAVIHDCFPEYEESYQRVLTTTNISYLNMFVASKEICDAYCTWLFAVLEITERRIGSLEDYDVQHRRIFGYLAEVLLNVWVLKHQLRIKYCFTLEVDPGIGEEKAELWEVQVAKKAFSVPLSATFRKLAYVVPIRLKQLERAAKSPYTLNLDRFYQDRDSIRKLSRYYKAYSNTEAGMDSVEVDGETIRFFRVLQSHKINYSYLQSNFRCIVTLASDDPVCLPSFVEAVQKKYGDQYTVTFRVVTKNPEIRQIEKHDPEVFVYTTNRG